MFSEFDNYLNLDFLVDYWYDEGLGIALTLLSKFDEADWEGLKKAWTSRRKEWQVRCAEVLDLTGHRISTEILINLLTSSDDDVVVAAADSLRSKGDFQLDVNSIERLANLSKHGSAPVKAVLANLLGQLGVK